MNPDTVRRMLAGLAGLSVPFVAAALAKVGVAIPTEQIIAVEVGAAMYIGQSVVNAIHARSVASAQTAAATPAAAVADLNAGAK
jgi:hypothetical protein